MASQKRKNPNVELSGLRSHRNSWAMLSEESELSVEKKKGLIHLPKTMTKPSCGRKYGMQCMALSHKNIILLKRNKISSLAALLCPAITVVALGLLVLGEKVRNYTPIPNPAIDYCIGSSCETNGETGGGGGGGGEGDAFPSCLVFDRAGGKFGYGRMIPGATCTSVMYSPSNNDEVADIMSLAAKKSKMSHAKGGSATENLNTVLDYDVYGMETETDLNGFMNDANHFGYVGAVVRFNTTGGGGLGDDIYYDIWYNKTVIGNSWMAYANKDNMATTYATSSFALRVQRTVNEAILGVRGQGRAKIADEANAELTVKFKRFPKFAVTEGYKSNCDVLGEPGVSSTGPMFFFLAIMFDFLLAMSSVVQEREKGMLGAMRTVGVSEAVYWASWLIYFGVLLFFSVILLILVGLMFGDNLVFFKYTEFGVLFPLFFVYGMTMVAIAFMFAACLKQTKKVTTAGGGIFGLGLAIVGFFTIGGEMFSPMLMDPMGIPRGWLRIIYGAVPPLAFGTIAFNIQDSTQSQIKIDPATNISRYVSEVYTVANYSGFPITSDPNDNINKYINKKIPSFFCPDLDKSPDDCIYHSLSMADVFSPVYYMFFVALALAWYFGQVCASGDGRSRPFYFVCNPLYWCPGCRGKRKNKSNLTNGGDDDDGDLDPNVKEENRKCREGNKTMAAIRCSNLVKRYGNFTAVDGLCVSMEKGKIFALLGHNGAGKTTSIKMMTGLENVTSGEADISGYNIETETQNVRENIGVCPQHDVLWPQLTAREHLEVYSMFKGVWDAKDEIDTLLEGVKLTDVQHKECGKFSGGMKRRLSVAISAMGNPDVIFLDEPTTGMDPMNRKSVWDTIKTFKKDKCVVLTTHSMEEADALGDRIGIMSQGKMVAIGTSLELKARYGAGYRVKLVCDQAEPVKETVARIMPNAKLVDDSAGSLAYGVDKDSMDKMAELFRWIEANSGKRSSAPLTDWAVSNTTLEEVFIQLARHEEEENENDSSDGESNPIALDIAEPVATADIIKEQGGAGAKNDSPGSLPPGKPKGAVALLATSGVDVVLHPERDAVHEALVAEKDKSLSNQLRALLQQRFHNQKRQFRGNLKLFLCPLIGVIVLVVLFNVFDGIQRNIDAQLAKRINNAKKACAGCRAITNSVCKACVKLGETYDPAGSQWNQQRDCTSEYDELNKPDLYADPYQEAQNYFVVCQVCNYCSSTTFLDAPVSDHYDRPSERYKRRWNGTEIKFAPPKFSFLKGSAYRGCDAILSFCNQNITKAVCSCSRAEPTYTQIEDYISCGRSELCGLELSFANRGLSNDPPFVIPKTVDDKVQSSTVADSYSSHRSRYNLLRPGSTSARIGIVGPSSKALYIGEKPGGFSESVAGLNCQQSGGAKSDDPDQTESFPPTTMGYKRVCDSDMMGSSNPYKNDYQNIIEHNAQTKFEAKQSGLVGKMAQGTVYINDVLNSSYIKYCNRGLCNQRASCDCVGVRALSWNDEAPLYDCADISCTDSGKINGVCPAVTKICSSEAGTGGGGGCTNKPIGKQKVFVSPSYVLYDSAETIDKKMYAAQETVLTDPRIFKYDEAMEAMESVDSTFLSAAVIFNSVDETKLRYDVTLQSYFTQPGCLCCFLRYYPLVHLKRERDVEECRQSHESIASNLAPNTPVNLMLSISNFGFRNKIEVGTPNWMLSVVSNAILRKEGLGTTITTGVKPLPYFKKTEEFRTLQLVNAFKLTFGYFVVGLALCLTFSPLITIMVEEKELKLKAMMRMMGMDDRIALLVTYLWNLLFATTFNTWLLIAGKIATAIYSGETVFSRSDGLIIFFLFLVYSHAQALFIFFVSNFFQRAKKVGTFSTVMMVLSSIIMMVLEDFVFTTPAWKGQPAPVYIMLIPPFALFRGLQLLNKQAVTWETLTPDHELSATFGYLILASVLFFLLDMYASQVLPREFGIRQPWNFPCLKVYSFLRERRRKLKRLSALERRRSHASITEMHGDGISDGKIAEDDDVTKEREDVITGVYNSDNSHIITYGLNKMYGSFTAVNTLSFHVPKGECFGLLGPNGAGKTTAISMLTGLFPPTKGNANLCGYDLEHELKSIYSVMGICPQFDICWPQLTIKEHLEFYARIKGVNQNQMENVLTKLLEEVDLLEAKDKLSKDLSGGMRRRLSLAMALVGDPDVVFLDEPTTGLDPETKRNIWALLDRVKENRCIVLTTHSMDEADALCGRIGIMSHGLMRCLGTNLHLKNRYGNGYKIEIRFVPEKKREAHRFIMKLLPKAKLVEEHGDDVLMYEVGKSNVVLSNVFQAMQKRPSNLGILDYGVRQTSLEEVFLKIARESEAAFHSQRKKI